MQESGLGMMSGVGNMNISSGSGLSGGGGGGGGGDVSISGNQDHHLKAEMVTHPLYERLLAAHVSCLPVATPIDQLPLIDTQLSQSHHVLRS